MHTGYDEKGDKQADGDELDSVTETSLEETGDSWQTRSKQKFSVD